MKVNLFAMCVLMSSASLLFATDGRTQDLENTRIVLALENASLYAALVQIEQQCHFRFTYKRGMIEGYSNLKVSKGRRSVKATLDLLFRYTSIAYEQVGHYIVLTEVSKDLSGEQKADLFVAAMTVSGKVTDDVGEPLPGVNVLEKGTTNGTTTDVNGVYSLAVSDENAILVFSFIGYTSQEVVVNGRAVIDVGLEPEVKSLDEVIVVGYGVQKKANLTGAVDQVSSDVLDSRPITNVGRALQGVIPNLNVTNSDGSPNSEPTMNIRGITSINEGSPLVLVDGIQMNLNMLNPNDIESITVLKDAASAAIYGARGAFGVILVTLKDGAKVGRPVITYTGGVEFSKPTFLPDMLSSLEYMESTNIATQRRNGNIVYSDQQIEWARAHVEDPENNPVYHVQPNGSIFWHANVNNFEEMLQSWAPAQNHSINVQGGDQRTSYYASLGYRDQEGMFKDATDVFKRYNGLINLSTQVTDWLNVGFRTNFTSTGYDQPHRYTGKGISWWEQMTRGVPQILFPIKTPADAPIPNAPTEHFYNFLTAGGRNVTQTQLAVYSVDTEISVTKGLKLRGDFSYSSTTRDRKDVRREFGYVRDKWEYQYGHTVPSFVEREHYKSDYFATNAYLTYDKTFAKDHDFSALVGFNQEWFKEDFFYVQGNNLISNDIPVLKLATGETYKDDREMDWAIRGVFMRLNYSFLQKYLLEMNGRYDGTSRFPRVNRFQFFPSFSAGWIISEENFMDGASQVLSFLKLRGSYGSLGNQNLNSAYAYVSNFGVVNNISYILGDQLPLGLTPPGMVRHDLSWETASTIDFGIDATLWNKLDIGFDWYKRVTSDMLVAGEKLPAVLGTGVPRRNGAELETIGIELSLKWKDQLANGLSYNVGVVMSDYKAIITKYDNNPNRLWTTYYEGQSVGEIWGYETVGIFQSQDEINNAASHSQVAGVARRPGDIQYADLNGDGVINWGNNTVTNPGDKKIIGNTTPRYQYGITGSLNWKGVDFRLFFQGVGKRDIYPTGNYYWGKINSAGSVGTREVYYNSWSEEDTGAYYPIYKDNSGFNVEPQTRYLQSAAYIRLKNLTLGYTLPVGLINKIGLQNIRLYVSSENLWEATKLRGNFDPEVVTSGQNINIPNGQLGQYYPLQRTFAFGVQVGL